MSNEIKIILTGDATGAVNAVSALQKQVSSFGGGAKSFNSGIVKGVIAPLATVPVVAGVATAALLEVKAALVSLAFISVIGAVVTGIVLLAESLFSAKTQTKELTEEQKKYNTAVQQSVDSTAKEATKVAAIVDRLKDGNLSRKESIALIKELQKTAPDYFGTLDVEKSKISDITNAYNNYNASLVRAIENQIITAQLTDVITKKLTAQQQFPAATKFINDALVSGKSLQDIAKENNQLFAAQNEKDIKRLLANKGLTKEQEKQNAQLSGQGAAISFVLAKLFEEETLLKRVNNADLKQLGVSFSDLKTKASKVVEETDKIIKSTKVISLQDLAKNIGGKASSADVNGLTFNTENAVLGIDNATDAMKRFGDEVARQAADKAQADLFTKKQAEALSYGAAITNVLGPSFQNLFDNILSGSQNAFQAFGQAIKQVITKLISAAITAAIFAAIISVAFGGSFAVGFKSAFSSLSGLNLNGLIPGKAGGARNYAGGVTLVGERGPELVNLPRGSDVIPNHMMGFGASSQELHAFISNRGIYLSNKRGGATAGRLG